MKTLAFIFPFLFSAIVFAADIGHIFTTTGHPQLGQSCPPYYVDPECNPHGLSSKQNAWDLAKTICLPNSVAKVSGWKYLNTEEVTATFICISAE